MKLYLKLRGEQGHNWPILNIKQDGVFQKFEIIEFQEIDIDLDNAPFTLGMYNKLFGKNRIWDTKVDREGNIIADKIIWIERFEIDEVDIGAGDMARRVESEKAAFEIEKQGQSEEFAKRQKDIDDSKSNNTMERAMTVVQQTNQTVNEGSKSTTIVPTGTEPQDSFAGNMALAQ